ncbi:DUF226 domain-containing protein (plasmid) [Borrelia miyamotoi]|uniref:DUF226 domain-containing protein n=1 Tax=Borrelia miyamotoi TaxID=47466 RepID=A0A5P8AV13_9SPIR|nr:DUF226 domain-containing protein [Borrelia miyamotoi]WAZ72784.1 DUF226 domain-containing protein [Borrelia miyamotoi]WVI05613.1 DUF226 domain-containing protein [Borrelia miyamotoi]
METILERLKDKKSEVKVNNQKPIFVTKKEKPLFIKVEVENNRTLYHTNIMMDLYVFGINKNQKHKFFISFRGLFNQKKVEAFNLFSIKGDDDFLGIFYGYRKPIKNVAVKYEKDGISKTYTFSKVYYIGFKFNRGDIFCYLKGISRLLKKESSETKYYKSLINKFLNLEREVYEFYEKQLPKGGLIKKWIAKNQK